MGKNIKKIGLFGMVIGLLCFFMHIIIHFKGNSLLFTGLALVLAGAYTYIKGWKKES